MADYIVKQQDGAVHELTCEDVHITEGGAKFLDGKGKAAVVVAYFPHREIVSIKKVN